MRVASSVRWIAILAIAVVSNTACSRPADPALLEQHRNLGKAFYENPTTHAEAVAEFQAALGLAPDSVREQLNYALALLRADREAEAVDLLTQVQRRDPTLPHTWFNLGIYYKQQGDTDLASAQFEGFIARAPQEPIGHYQLGTLYRQIGRDAEAQAEFERAAALDPLLAAARFQLYNLFRQQGLDDQASTYLAEFQRLQQIQQDWATPEDVEWCPYAEIYDPPETRTVAAEPPTPNYTDVRLPGAVDPQTAGLTLLDATGAGQTDLLAWSSEGIRLFSRGAQPVATALDALTGAIDVVPGDFDNDGLPDLCVLTAAGPQLYHNTGGLFVRQAASLPARRFDRAVWLDFDHDYDLDLVLLGAQPALARNQGSAGWVDRTGDFPFLSGAVVSATRLRVDPDSKSFDLAVFYANRAPVLYRDQLGGRYLVESYQGNPAARDRVDADFDADGGLDRAEVRADGAVHLLHNQNPGARSWVRVRLTGVRSLKLAQDALVEIKAGAFYRRAFYTGVPLLFDTGDAATLDVVRITWPNGLIQNEVRQSTRETHAFEEAQRLSGSCPMIWTWNGEQVEFITDVLGVAPLGASDGDGSYFPVDHDEYVRIPAPSLQPVGGYYDIRVTEELSEVSYLDQLALYAVDHPRATEIFTNEKFVGPPYPEFRLYGVEQRVYPRSARDDAGRDVLSLLTARDQRYPDRFERSPTGVAQLHYLELDFGRAAAGGPAVLLLNGWVDWPDGSTFRQSAQELDTGLVVPFLQIQDAPGDWQTVNPDMGMPAGKPKTIAVPLEFPTASRRVRIGTNLSVYWDEIFLSEGGAPAPFRPQAVPLASAGLQFRGFSESRIDPQRKQPDSFLYQSVSPVSFWNPTPGLYTRYGAVEELVSQVDDRMVIMGSGDELRLRFHAGALAPPPSGWSRDFLLKVDGWAKDRDPNTAFSAGVEPLPFHGMSQYPYPSSESYPNDPAHRQYREEYNTRPALVLIRPLQVEHRRNGDPVQTP